MRNCVIVYLSTVANYATVQQKENSMKIKFNREYLPILASFMAVNDVRFYLNGFHVKPHPEAGVVLTATDGHRLVTIYDKNGLSDGEYILPISKPLLTAAKKTSFNKLPLNSVQFIDNKVFVLCHNDNDEFDFFQDDSEHSVSFISHLEYIQTIDGRFPNTKRIFSAFKPKQTDHVGVNVDYIGKLKSVVTNKKFPQLNLMFSGKDGSICAVSGYDKEIVSLIMPARFDDEDMAIPEFVNFGGGDALGKADTNEPK